MGIYNLAYYKVIFVDTVIIDSEPWNCNIDGKFNWKRIPLEKVFLPTLWRYLMEISLAISSSSIGFGLHFLWLKRTSCSKYNFLIRQQNIRIRIKQCKAWIKVKYSWKEYISKIINIKRQIINKSKRKKKHKITWILSVIVWNQIYRKKCIRINSIGKKTQLLSRLKLLNQKNV